MKLRLLFGVAVVGVTLLMLWIFCLPRELFSDVQYSTVVTSSDGTLLGARVADDGQWRFPPCDTIPEKFAKALVEFEDRTFLSHHGVSLRALARATVQNVRNKRIVSGGSTISMQVIRLSRRMPRTLWQKFVEMFMATRLEFRYSKTEILNLYASHAPFGGNVVGINAALWRYLDNGGADLSWAEAATLAVLQNAPSSIHLAKNRDLLMTKRNRLLARLNEKGEISDMDYAFAVEEPLIGDPRNMPQYAPHLVEWFNRTAHGKRTSTNIDFELQCRAEALLSRWSVNLRESGINDLAAVIIEVESGEVVAYCGNSDMSFEREGKWVDIARAPRSSGSILKPLLFASALQQGTILPHSLLPDIPTDFGGFAPKNFDGSYSGVIEADKALALSLNVPNVHLLKEYGVMNFAETLKRAGFQSISRPSEEYGLSLVLGGAEVSLLDVVSCYAKMSACYQDTTRYCGFPLRDRVALYSTFNAMREVGRPDQLDWRRAYSVQNVAWKTGTSYGARDAWAVGVTPEYVVGVWVGNAGGDGVAGLTGVRMAGPVMFDLFDLLPNCGWFPEPTATDGIEMAVCTRSGYVAGRNCEETEQMTLPRRSVNTRTCPYCHSVAVSLDGRRRVIDRSEPIRLGNYFTLPPDVEHFYRPQHPEYLTLPPLKDGSVCVQTPEMKFIYPMDGSIITLPRQLDGSQGTFVCEVAHTTPSAELFWHLDNAYLGSTRDIHRMQVSPSKGVHTITVVDETGRSLNVSVVVVPPDRS